MSAATEKRDVNTNPSAVKMGHLNNTTDTEKSHPKTLAVLMP
jgi:hypothetical protein